jgi:hypothetical protein
MRTNKISLKPLHKPCEILRRMKVLIKSASGLDHQQWCPEMHSKYLDRPKLCGKNIKFLPVKSDGV